MKTWTTDEMKPGLIVGCPQMKNVGSEWHQNYKPTGKIAKVVVVETKPNYYDKHLEIWGYALTKDGAISQKGQDRHGNHEPERFDNIDQIIDPADEALMQEARSLALPDWVRKEVLAVGEKAIKDGGFFARVRAANWDSYGELIAEAQGVSVEDVALRHRAESIADTRYGICSDLDKAVRHSSESLVEKSSEFGVEDKVKEAVALIAQAKAILDSLTVESLMARRVQSETAR